MRRPLAVLVVLLVGWTLSACEGPGPRQTPAAGGGPGKTSHGPQAAVASSPLSARHGSAVVWTGAEVVVVGGDRQRPCPAWADCLNAPRPAADVAAYDPAADTWRALPDLPVPAAKPVSAWNGAEVVVVAGGETFALDLESDAWRRLDRAPLIGDSVTRVGGGLVFVAYQQAAQGEPVDWLLGEEGRWSPLPRDPFGESYDRSMACDRLGRPDVLWDQAVWADRALFVWGSDFDRDVTAGILWRPPSPG